SVSQSCAPNYFDHLSIRDRFIGRAQHAATSRFGHRSPAPSASGGRSCRARPHRILSAARYQLTLSESASVHAFRGNLCAGGAHRSGARGGRIRVGLPRTEQADNAIRLAGRDCRVRAWARAGSRHAARAARAAGLSRRRSYRDDDHAIERGFLGALPLAGAHARVSTRTPSDVRSRRAPGWRARKRSAGEDRTVRSSWRRRTFPGASDRAQDMNDAERPLANTNKTVFQKRESRVRSYARHFPLLFARAEGSYLYDVQGKAYLDFLSGAGSLNYGHNHPVLRDALVRYIRDCGVTHSLDLHTTAKAEFLETLETLILRPRDL